MKRFYVLGNPVNHSLSPKVFTYIFNKLNIKASYSSYLPQSLEDLKLFLKKEINNYSGLNITLPYKIDVYNYINKHDKFSSAIQAVNCIKNVNNQLVGYNTDYYGFTKMLNGIDVDRSDILILGNGGAARTAVYSLSDYSSSNIYIWGRNKQNVETFIKNINSEQVKQYSKSLNKSYIIINCLPLILDKSTIDMIINDILPEKFELFIDLNYLETIFSKKLIDKKYNVILGLDMFIFQALKSFDIWFDNKYHDMITYEEIKNLLSK